MNVEVQVFQQWCDIYYKTVKVSYFWRAEVSSLAFKKKSADFGVKTLVDSLRCSKLLKMM